MMLFCFKCVFEDDLAVPRPGDEDRFTYPSPDSDRNPDRIARPAVTVVGGEAKCHVHFHRDHREPIRLLDPR